MGDVVSLVEKAAQTIDMEKAQAIAEKMRKGEFDLEDLSDQLKQMEKLGGMSSMMGMLPGIGKVKKQLDAANIDDSIIKRQRAIISVDDAEGAAQPQGPRRQAQAPHRRRLRHQARGRQPAPQDAPPDGGHDEDDGQARRPHAAHDGHGRRRRRRPSPAEIEKMQAELARLDPKALEPCRRS